MSEWKDGLNRTATALLAGALILGGGCADDFETLNTDPNAPVDVQPELLLRQVAYDYIEQMSYEGFTGGANLGQYFSADPGFNAFDRGDLLAPQFGGNPWPILYRDLRDIEIVLAKSRANPLLAVYEGPALVLRAHIAGTLTDIFGDVPYTEAVRGLEGTVDPAYDLQQDIYRGPEGILASLREAAAVMDAYAGTVPLEGDILYDGDLAGWTRLANSLRLKYLVRASDRLDAAGLAEITELAASAPLITEGSQDAVYRFGAAPNDFRFARARLGDFTNYLMSRTVDSVLGRLDDPRERLWFRASAAGSYGGVVNGLAPTTPYDADTVSLPGEIWRERATDLKGNFMTAWETHFLLAEAALRGFTDGDARALYEEGVRLAFAYWDTPLPDDYLTAGLAAWGNADPAPQIATQRWLASIGNGYEGWIEWRRTGYPTFMAPATSLNGGAIPTRFPYPVNEQALNRTSYEAAVERLGGENSANVMVWWDSE